MENKINEILSRFEAALPGAKTAAEVAALSASVTGPNGELTAIMKTIPTLPVAERPVVGKLINVAKRKIEPMILDAYKKSERAQMAKALGEKIDPTLPPCEAPRGALHPLTLTIRRICGIFRKLGFTVAEATDMETEWFCFDALNTPADHPARDAQDTLFLPRSAKAVNVSKHADELYLLRSHTSSVQIRAMMKEGASIRIVAPGRAFRRDTVDATHSANFHQIECLYIDKGVKLTDLKAVLDYMFRELFGSKAKTRLRPSFFPFTEPSFEVDFMSPDMGRLSN
ncbi:MAG: phenylalanine--tRNA ligase subunit alpha, partial [Opitutales bacterium]|nr:phenylalanine--tRNA ligase subunit alpha [Opitutales bacterium]